MLTDTYRLTHADAYDPKGPDGQGRNRLRIEFMEPSDRCGLRPTTKAAAMDLLRGMLGQTSPTFFGLCDGQACSTCRRSTKDRDSWCPEWIIREDAHGRPWILTMGRGWDSYGIWYRDWAALIASTEVPMLRRDRDQHGLFYCAA